MKKAEIIGELINTQKRNLGNLKTSLETVRREAREAPGANVSHSDTSKFQQSNLALGIQGRINEIEFILRFLGNLSTDKRDEIVVGSLFAVENQSCKENNYYLLVSIGGGETFAISDRTIMTISAQAPLAIALIGKKAGYKVNFRGDDLKVVEVQ